MVQLRKQGPKRLDTTFETLGLYVLTHTERYLSECLQSVVDQTRQPTSCIVVDNGSPRGESVGSIARSFGFDVLRVDRPVHYTTGRNLGCQALDGCDLLVNLDGDDVLLPAYIETYWGAALEHNTEIVYGCAEYIGDRDGVFGAGFGRPVGRIRRGNFIPANSLFSRRLWQHVGGFDSNVGLLDDWDFWLSCFEAGASATYVDVPQWQYRRHSTSNLASPDQADVAASYELVIGKHDRFINGRFGWRVGARWLDQRTGRARRGLKRRAATLLGR